jgi:branched-chain amino acid transport system substrate-binding protein
LQKFHPEVKTVASLSPESPELPTSKPLSKKYASQYGITWLGVESFPLSTADFMPIIQKVLELKPDSIDTMTSVGDLGPAGILLIKQLREAGFKGPIFMRANPDTKTLLEVLGKEGAEGCIDIGINMDSSLVPAAYKDLIQRYEKKYDTLFLDIVGPYYNATSAFLEFLNTQNTLDTTQWAEAFAKYKWTGIFGDSYWGGKPTYTGNHICIRPLYMSEWHDGKRDTKFSFIAPQEIAGD